MQRSALVKVCSRKMDLLIHTHLRFKITISLPLVIFSPLVDLLPRLGCLSAAKSLHRTLLNGILHAPNAFFDTTPVGRILTRFSKDIETLDTKLPRTIPDLVYFGLEVS